MEGAAKRNRGIGKRHVGIAGVMLALSQYIGSLRSEHAIKEIVEPRLEQVQADIKTSRAQSEHEIERDFMRKAEIGAALQSIDSAVQRVAASQEALNVKVGRIEGYLKAKQHESFSLEGCGLRSHDVSHR